ncbi:unnamed protein product [Dibothriocephalus latus]|uniref:Ras-associating domain-containing protein n=1 Tax=Dibothriocephalus latus TaxID=60516 RepID=A0A3P7LLH6_DIBLA|nr:unnamed protein product [Dibothriocephalus latus]
MEFFGVVRFYFHGPDDKYHSKCVRISSFATARHLVNVLVEKFHPDLRQLKAGKYALYEYHPSSGGKVNSSFYLQLHATPSPDIELEAAAW